MPETDGLPYVTRNECFANINSIRSDLANIKDDIEHNRETNDKIIKILQGNGEGGLIWKVNSLMLRNQWIDKGVSIAVSILSTLLTLYLTGVLHI